MDIAGKTTEGRFIVELKTTGKETFSNHQQLKHIRQVLNYRRECILNGKGSPEHLRLVHVTESGNNSVVKIYGINLGAISRVNGVLDARDEKQFKTLFKDFRDAGQLLQERDCFTCKSLAECFPPGTTQAQIGRESHAMISCMVKSAFRGKNECEGLLARTSCLTND
jgi:hypothetical protein